MICYKDITFCKYKECIKFKNCKVALTDEIKKDAEKWWGNKDYPIVTYIGKPKCYESEE